MSFISIYLLLSLFSLPKSENNSHANRMIIYRFSVLITLSTFVVSFIFFRYYGSPKRTTFSFPKFVLILFLFY